MGMSATTRSVTAASFEKVFAAIATKRTFGEYPAARANHNQSRDLADWRAIAWAAIEGRKLGDALRRAIEALPVKYREMLFLRDVKNLNTAEAAWILNITVGVARSRLRRARAQVLDALVSGVLRKPREKNSDLGNSCAYEFPYKFGVPTRRIHFLPPRQRLMSA